MSKPEQYSNQIRDFHDLDIAFKFAQDSSKNNDKEVMENLKNMIYVLNSDIIKTNTERDRKNIDKIEVIFSEGTNEILDRLGGLSQIFDKVKEIVSEQISEGKISDSDRDKILSEASAQIRKNLDTYRKTGKTIGDKENRKTLTISPNIEQLNAFSKYILNNDKLVQKISDNIKGTVKGQCKKQSISVINFLTGNKYKELELKIKKNNISKVSTLLGTAKNLTAFEKIKSFKKTKIGKVFNYKNLLKHFNVKRQRLGKRGFLGLYNQYVYKELMRRIEEFTNVTNFKGKMGKDILKGLLKWGGGFILSGITATLGFGWKMMKSAWKQVVNITKAVGNLGISIFKRVKQFLFTSAGMWIVGFFSGIVYAAIIKPIMNKFKAWFDIILKPLKEWLGIGEKEDITIDNVKQKLSQKLKEQVKEDIRTQKNIKIAKAITTIQDLFINVEQQLKDINTLMNGGGWKRQVAGAISASAGTIGTLVGMGIGSLICPGLGTWIGAAVGGLIGGFAASWTNNFARHIRRNAKESLTLSGYARGMRKKWQGYTRQNNKNNEQYQDAVIHRSKEKEKIDETQKKIDYLNLLISSDPNNTDAILQREDLMKTIDKAKQDYNTYNLSVLSYGYEYDEEETDIVDNIIKKIDDGAYYFDLKYLDSKSIYDFWNNALKGKFEKRNPKNGDSTSEYFTQEEIGKVKTKAFITAITKYNNGEISFNTIPIYAYRYMMNIKQIGKRQYREPIKEIDARGESERVVGYEIRYVLDDLDDKKYDFDKLEDYDKIFYEIIKTLSEEYKTHDILIYTPFLLKLFREQLLQNYSFSREDRNKLAIFGGWKKIKEDMKKVLDKLIERDKCKEDELSEQYSELSSGSFQNILEGLQLMEESEIKLIRVLDESTITKEEEKELIEQSKKATLGSNDSDIKREIQEIQILTTIKDNKQRTEDNLREEIDKQQEILDRFKCYEKRMTPEQKKIVEDVDGIPQVFLIGVENDDNITSANDQNIFLQTSIGSDYLRGVNLSFQR